MEQARLILTRAAVGLLLAIGCPGAGNARERIDAVMYDLRQAAQEIRKSPTSWRRDRQHYS